MDNQEAENSHTNKKSQSFAKFQDWTWVSLQAPNTCNTRKNTYSIDFFSLFLQYWFSTTIDFYPHSLRYIWQWLETFLIVMIGGIFYHLLSIGQRWCQTSYNVYDNSQQKRITQSQISIVIRLRNSALKLPMADYSDNCRLGEGE